MIFDWHLWPWMVAEQAGGMTGVHLYRMERSIERVQHAIGDRLLPVFRRLGVSAVDAIAAFQALSAVGSAVGDEPSA